MPLRHANMQRASIRSIAREEMLPAKQSPARPHVTAAVIAPERAPRTISRDFHHGLALPCYRAGFPAVRLPYYRAITILTTFTLSMTSYSGARLA